MSKFEVELNFTVKKSDTLDSVAPRIMELIVNAQEKCPNQDRYLFLEIEGHRNANGGFDKDMMELQTHFLLGVIAEYVKGIKTPSYRFKNPKDQNNSFPPQEPMALQQAA